jgi:multicomponent Na+:H+ antiporter subunit A
MAFAPLLLIGLSFLASPIARRARGAAGWILAAAPAALFVYFAGFLPLGPGEAVRQTLSWVPGLGVELSVNLDGLSATFALLVTGIGALVLVYAGAYMKGHPRRARLLSLLLFFLGAMLGLVLSDNLVALFVYWELTSVCSYLMIGLEHEKEPARDAARQALVITGAGGLCLLGGVVLLGVVGSGVGLGGADSLSISKLLTVPVRGHALYPAVVILIALGAFTKSAQAPFHFWLPGAMTAPTPVSALLHSATMVKAGVYLLARLQPMLGGTALWEGLLVTVGVITMFGAAMTALGQHDMKRILAYSTVSVLGMLVALVGAGNDPSAAEAAVVLLVAHAFYKAALFMVAGNVDHEAGTRDITVLGGLRRAMPLTFAAGLVAAFSKAGAPPMFGFVGKEILYTGLVTAEVRHALVILLAVATNVALVATSLMVAFRPFVGPRRDTPKPAHEAPPGMLLGPLVLATAGLFVGIAPGVFDSTLGSAMATAISGTRIDMHLALWHGVNPTALTVLAMSGITLLAGIFVFRKTRHWLAPMGRFIARVQSRGPQAWYRAGLEGLTVGGDRVTRLLQNGYLRNYVLVTVLAAVAIAAPPLLRSLGQRGPVFDDALRIHEALIAGLALAGAVAAAFMRGRLSAVAALGVTGGMIALLFMLFSAPDLSITQVMVETLGVILFVLVFSFLPRLTRRTRGPRVLADLFVALLAGAFMTGLAFAATSLRLPPDAAEFYANGSYLQAHGRNVVNVILVDFRAMDTMGEIAVIAAAGFGIYAMLRLVPSRGGPA